MPFSIDDRENILIQLGLPPEEEVKVQACLDNLEKRSEKAVLRCQQLLKDIEDAENEFKRKALDGISQAGEVKFDDEKLCHIRTYQDELKYKLAQRLGYPYLRVLF